MPLDPMLIGADGWSDSAFAAGYDKTAASRDIGAQRPAAGDTMPQLSAHDELLIAGNAELERAQPLPAAEPPVVTAKPKHDLKKVQQLLGGGPTIAPAPMPQRRLPPRVRPPVVRPAPVAVQPPAPAVEQPNAWHRNYGNKLEIEQQELFCDLVADLARRPDAETYRSLWSLTTTGYSADLCTLFAKWFDRNGLPLVPLPTADDLLKAQAAAKTFMAKLAQHH
jgi:hypothetical protein